MRNPIFFGTVTLHLLIRFPPQLMGVFYRQRDGNLEQAFIKFSSEKIILVSTNRWDSFFTPNFIEKTSTSNERYPFRKRPFLEKLKKYAITLITTKNYFVKVSAQISEKLCEMILLQQFVSMLKSEAFAKPTPIQAQSWPIAFSGYDMVGLFLTGSSKNRGSLIGKFNNKETPIDKSC